MALIGPFKQLLTLDKLPSTGPIPDDALEIIPEGAIRFDGGKITEIGRMKEIQKSGETVIPAPKNCVALPGWIDAHTHICFAGSRAADYALRLAGASYQEIAARGGGILDTVARTRAASREELEKLMLPRIARLISQGITTCEVKSGYGLTLDDELKMLEAIETLNKIIEIDLIPTCLAAHVCPPEFKDNSSYIDFLIKKLLPILNKRRITKRLDIFVDKNAFSVDEARTYLAHGKKMGFTLCIHADQFSRGGSRLAAEMGAATAEHLEQTTKDDAIAMKKAGVIPVVLPGASLGLGMDMPPARMLLDQGLPLVIASDWNPGSAPMGNLIAEASILAASDHLTTAEVFAALTTRAASALQLNDRGCLRAGFRADFTVYNTSDYREILYNQGSLKPFQVYAQGRCIFDYDRWPHSS